jgi:DnaJ-class molecular chaperone
MSDPYEILGVQKNADDEEIKRAYRKLSLRYHPDRNTDPDATKKFQEINNAYESIKTADLRQQREFQTHSPFANGPGPGPGPGDFDDINNMFNTVFGGFGNPMNPMNNFANGFSNGFQNGPGPNIRIFHNGGNVPMDFLHIFQQMNKPPPIVKTVDISLKQCYDGCSIPLEIERWIMDGNIRKTETETIYINVPMGIEENEFVMVQERGNIVNENLKGDIKIGFRILNTTSFERAGLDLIYKKTISLKEALCGFSFEIRHLNDKTLSIHNKTNVNVISPGYRKMFPQMGMKRNGTTGNLIVELNVQFPDKLSTEQMEILGQIL